MVIRPSIRDWRRRRRPYLEWLETRTLFSVSPLSAAPTLVFNSLNVAQATHFLSSPGEVDLYRVKLEAGDTIEAGISAQDSGNQAGAGFTFTFPGFGTQGTSALSSLLRVFDAFGTPLALDDQQGGDPSLTFQVPLGGDYYVGVSSAPNVNYNPNLPGSDTAGGTTGLYTLGVRLITTAPLLPDLTGSSFLTSVDMAAAGDQVPVNFTVENRGGANPGNFQVQVLLADNNTFDSSSKVLATLTRAELAAGSNGRDFSSPAGFSVTVPTGLASGRDYLGLRIIADPAVPEAGLYDKSGVHRGTDWEWLTVVTRAPAGATDLSAVDAGLNTETTGTLSGLNQAATFSFTVSSALGDGEFTAEADPSGALLPRLTLSGPEGQLLIQSDSDRLVQSLQPGTYLVTVSARSGIGAYRLTTSFIQTSLPFIPLAAGEGTASVVVADVNGDGFPDIITANRIDDTVSVFLSDGDGTFQLPMTFAVGPRVSRIAVGNVVNDGKPALLVGNHGDNTISILLGNGDGTFEPQIVIPAGTRVVGAITADVNGDGIPDLIMDNYAADTIWVLLGNGNGTFGAPTIYPTDNDGQFQGVLQPTVADVNGDGIPDLIYPTYIGGDVVVRLGKGNGTFGPAMKFAARPGAYAVDVVDVNGDGILDLVCVNAVDNSVSVLLGNGNGTFKAEKVYPVGANPYSMIVADVNGDGIPDIITSNRNDNTVSVLLGTGNGAFQPQRVFQTGKTPRRVAVGDFNGDGKLDLVTANLGDNTAGVLLGAGDGTFSSGSQAAPAPDLRPFQVAVADLNGDGRPDIVTANRSDNSVSVLLSNPDGSFQTKETFATDTQPFSVAVGDVNGDGIPDIVTANYAGSSVSVLLGNGDGTFREHVDYPAGSAAYDAVLADVNHDGKLDIIVANKNDNTVGVLLGNGNGTFRAMKSYPVASGPFEVVVADVNGDGIPDIVVSHFSATVVDVLLGKGDGTFEPALEFPVGSRPYGLAVADVNGDGKPDIITANYRSADVSVLLGNGNGTFGPPQLIPVGLAPNEVKVADLNGDGIPDIVTANYGGNSVSVLLGNGNGSFQPQQTFSAGSGPASVAIADINGDGKLDLVVGNRNESTINVLLGNGNGTFEAPIPFGVGKNKYSVAVADVNGDGNADILTTSVRLDTVTVQLGDGDGTFEPGQTVAVGLAPTSVVVADLNGDGRPDLVTANSGGNSVSVSLGNGDGTFGVQHTFAVGRSPRRVVAADVNGDGIPDLIVTNYNDNTVSVLLGKGDGTFLPQMVFSVGAKPYGLTVADVNGDGKPDIIVADSAGDTVSVLLGNGNGTFLAQKTSAVGRQPFSVAVADVSGDGKLDIVTANAFDNTVSVLLGNGNGTFEAQRAFPVGDRPYSVAVTDTNGDGKPDIITSNYGDNSVSVLLGDGNGSFQKQQTFTTDQQPVQLVVADVNDDGRPDLVVASNHDSAIGVFLGIGTGSFQPVTVATGVALQDTPLLADLNGDGILDSIVLDRSGNILFRAGLPGSDDTFAPPVILNPGRPARDIAIVNTGHGLAIAAADAHYDPTLSTNHFVFTVSLYLVAPNGSISHSIAFSSTALPVRLAAADLTGNGLDDLIVANSLDDSVSISIQTAPGKFAAPIVEPVGVTPSDIAVADVNGDGLPDVVVTDQSSGDVTVLLNNAAHSFSQTLRFRAGAGPDIVDATTGAPALNSADQSVSVVAGDFMGNGSIDLIVVNAGAHSFSLLPSDGNGFSNPSASLTTSTSDGLAINGAPGEVVVGDFNRDDRLDLAVLMQDTGEIWIYTNNGNGMFSHTSSIPVGDEATGLSVVPGSGPGLLDLLVGNGFGDVLHLQGKGDGTFQISGNKVSLSVVPNLLGPGQAGVLVGNQQDNSVTVQTPTSGGSQLTTVQKLAASNPTAQLAPGDVQWFLLDKDATLPDAVVVSSGSNAVVVYRTTAVSKGVLSFAATPQTYFVGTNPASVTVADVNGDGIPDMIIADQDSNDVSVLFGSYDANGNWVGLAGPRLKSGGDGPIAVTVRDMNNDGIPDLVVTNGGSGTVTLLPGVGQGFFDDQHPETLFNLGGAVVQPPTFVGDTEVGYVVT
ncbi:MAG TPA: FG-GAP-like repeat-containing protein, partial [Gemmataceae bacterium]|nr:FG-GAP-like repeat-containing protein [Gemmataceae bacterium]